MNLLFIQLRRPKKIEREVVGLVLTYIRTLLNLNLNLDLI